MRGTPYLHEGFTGGLNTISDPYLLEETETRECLNVVSTERGSIKKRTGSTVFGTPPNVEFLSVAPVTVNGVTWLVAATAEKLYSVNTAGEYTEIGSGFHSGFWSVVQAPSSTGVPNQGPVYLSNGNKADKPQYWSANEKATGVSAWTGIATSPKLTDGVLESGKLTVKSKTAKFIATDVGLTVTFETAVKQKSGGTEIKTAQITAVKSAEEVQVEINEEGWEKEFTGVHFTLTRAYYEDPTSKEHVPNGRFMVFAGNRIWMAGMVDDQHAVRFSETAAIGEGGEQADPSSWPKENVVRFDNSDGKPITGLGVVGPYVLVFKESKCWAIHNLDSGENRKLSDTVGCVANRSIVETNMGTFFLTADQGVYLTEGSKLHEMSYNVRPTILAINPAQRENAAGAYFNNHYYLSYCTGAEAKPTRTLDYDTVLKSWWLHDLAGWQWAIWAPTAGAPALFTLPPKAKAGAVRAFVAGVWTDSGSNYTGNGVLGAFWLSSWTPFSYYVFRHRIKSSFLKKRVRQVFFNGEGQIIPAVYKNFQVGERQEPSVVGNREISTELKSPTEFSATAEKWGEGAGVWGVQTPNTEILWGGESSIGAARLYSLGTANMWSVGWGNNSAEPFVVNSYVMMIQFRKS